MGSSAYDAGERAFRAAPYSQFRVVAGACLGSGALSAQETRLEGDLRHGGFGAPVVKFTEVDSRFGVLVGGRGG